MAETCEKCGKPIDDWSATHCSEYCLLEDIQFSKTVYDSSEFDIILSRMRKNNRFDRNLLDDK